MSYVLAIDQSTSATKGLLFDLEGRLLDQVVKEHRQIYPKPGWVEHDGEEIYWNTLAVAGELLAKDPGRKKDLLCLSLTNQRETILIFNKKTGHPLHHAIVWQDRRGAPVCAGLVQTGCQPLVRERTGLAIDTYFSASKLRWLVDTYPETAKKMQRGEALIGTIDTYLIYRLTGGQVHATDQTNASRTLLFDIHKLAWDEQLCSLFRVPVRALPEVRDSVGIYGQTKLNGILDHPIPICGVMGDSQAALFAQGCYEPGMVKVTLGTGCSILMNIGNPPTLSQQGIVTTIAWVYRGQTTYAFEGIINFSAATISWLKNQLLLISSPAETEQLAKEVEDNGGVYLVPAFVGLSAPYWQPDARGAILGLSPASTRNHIVRAGLEAIAYQIKDVLDQMIKESGVPLQLINADGGASRNKFLVQFMADLLRYPIRVPEFSDLSALGVVFCGYLGMGLATSLDQLKQLPRNDILYEAKMSLEKAEEFYRGWKAAVQRVL